MVRHPVGLVLGEIDNGLLVITRSELHDGINKLVMICIVDVGGRISKISYSLEVLYQ